MGRPLNYFEDHIGDYAAATAHLSWDEDMAYTRLIRALLSHGEAHPCRSDLQAGQGNDTSTTPRSRCRAVRVLHQTG